MQGIWGAAVFAEALLKRGAKGDVVEAQEVINNLAKLPDNVSGVVRDIWLLRLAHCLLNPAATRAATENFGSGIARWRRHSVSRGICSGPRRWSERSDSRRRPPKTLKTLTGVRSSDWRQLDWVARFSEWFIGVQTVTAARRRLLGPGKAGWRRPSCDLADMSDQR